MIINNFRISVQEVVIKMMKDGQEKEVMIMTIIKNQKEDINLDYLLYYLFFKFFTFICYLYM